MKEKDLQLELQNYLEVAKTFLAEGSYKEAFQIVTVVKEKIDAILYKKGIHGIVLDD